MSVFEVKDFGGQFWTKLVNFGLDAHICDAKTEPFIHIGADLFVYLQYIGIQIIENQITGKIESCV